MKNLSFRLFVYTNPTKTHNENGKFNSSYKSVYFENSTTSPLLFTSCKRQNGPKPTHNFPLFCVNCTLRSRDYILVLLYLLNLFLAYETNQRKCCDTMNRVNIFENVFFRFVLCKRRLRSTVLQYILGYLNTVGRMKQFLFKWENLFV